MLITRRSALLGTSALVPAALALAACGTTSGSLLDPQVFADAQGIVAATDALVKGIMTHAPTAITADTQKAITEAEAAALAVITNLTTSTTITVGATALQKVDGYISTILSAVGPVIATAATTIPALAVIVPIYDAAVALLPFVEAWVNSVIATVTSPKAALGGPLKMVKMAYTPAQARGILGVKVAK
jgi:hypothetical protein